jgi:hypothetical protein
LPSRSISLPNRGTSTSPDGVICALHSVRLVLAGNEYHCAGVVDVDGHVGSSFSRHYKSDSNPSTRQRGRARVTASLSKHYKSRNGFAQQRLPAQWSQLSQYLFMGSLRAVQPTVEDNKAHSNACVRQSAIPCHPQNVSFEKSRLPCAKASKNVEASNTPSNNQS